MKKIEIFSALNTEKVLQDKHFSDAKKLKKIQIKAVKNSYELGQIVLTPNFDVKNCEFTLSPLVSNEGTFFEELNIEKFYQKYIAVKEVSYIETTKITRDINGQLGWFPDILLPYDAAVAHKENVISANQNQAIVLIFHIAKNQALGLYKGKIFVTVDEENLEFPIEIEVCDVTLPEMQKVDSLLCMEYEFIERGEQDVSLAMKEAYVEALLKYKQAPRLLPQAEDTVEDFCKAVRKYYHRIPGFSIPMDVAEYWGAPRVMDYEYLRKRVFGLAKISLEDGINYFEKVRNYMLVVDEPQQNKAENATSYACRRYRETLKACADEVDRWDVADGKVSKKEIAATIREKTYNLVTSGYTEKITGVDIWCPVYKSYTFPEKMEKYKASGKPYWGYSCNAQMYPLPNWHIDDMNSFLSARAKGWIMRDYGVSGNLYYETVLFEQLSYKNGLHLEPTDPYANPTKYPGANGDGYLFYPGIKYGIKGPVVCNRLSYIRDAVQDYDLLWLLENSYRERGANPQPLLRSIYDTVHSNTEVTLGSEAFFALKSNVIDAVLYAKVGKFFNDISAIDKGTKNQGGEYGKYD